MSDTRYYELSVQRLCGEFLCGTVSRSFYDYWLAGDDSSALVDYISNYDDQPDDDSEVPPIRDGEQISGWYEIDDIIHLNNAVVSDYNKIYVDEIVPDPDSHSGYRPKRNGFSEVYSIGDVEKEYDLSDITREVGVETYVDVPTTPVLVIKSIEKGSQTVVYIETEGAFDLKKLKFDVWFIDGDHVIARVFYDGVELDNHPDSSMGRDFIVYLGDLDCNETIEVDFSTASNDEVAAKEKPKPMELVLWAIPALSGLIFALIALIIGRGVEWGLGVALFGVLYFLIRYGSRTIETPPQ